MPKPVLLILALVVALAAPSMAQEAKDDSAAQRPPASESTSESDGHGQAQGNDPKPRSRPAQSFTPSERIRADTSVAFPADI